MLTTSLSRFIPLAAVVWAPLVLTGCTIKDALLSCLYDFQADVRAGENAGLSLTGEMSLEELDSGQLAAAFTDASGGEVDVDADYADGEITFTFTLGEEESIVGTGAFDAESCLDTIEGDLVGYGEGDTGDWAGTLAE